MPSCKPNQLTVMCTAHGERRLISIRYKKECLESKLNGQMDSHSDYSVYLRVVENFDTKSLKKIFFDNFVLHIFHEKRFCDFR